MDSDGDREPRDLPTERTLDAATDDGLADLGGCFGTSSCRLI